MLTMSSDTPSKGFLSSDNIKKVFNIDNPRMIQRLANKKTPKKKPSTKPVVGDTVGLLQPLTDLSDPSTGNNVIRSTVFYVSYYHRLENFLVINIHQPWYIFLLVWVRNNLKIVVFSFANWLYTKLT